MVLEELQVKCQESNHTVGISTKVSVSLPPLVLLMKILILVTTILCNSLSHERERDTSEKWSSNNDRPKCMEGNGYLFLLPNK